MPSSTSSSEAGAVTGPWGRTWLLALVLAAATLGAVEWEWRSRGFAPAVSDSARLWSAHRLRAEGLTRPGSVIVGTSRAQYAIDLDAFGDEVGWPAPIQLSLQGRSPLPVLKDLAEDPTFSGLVIVDVTERIYFQRTRQRERRARERIEESRELRANQTAAFESAIDQWIGETFVLRNPEVAPDRALALWADGFDVEPDERWVESDRSAKMDFSRVDPVKRHRRWLDAFRAERAPPRDVRNRIIRATRHAVETIRGRGGEVVFVRFPSHGALGYRERSMFPRDDYWDVLVERTGAPGIHFSDYESLKSFETPDGSHLDMRDADAFSRALARIVRKKTSPGT